MRTPQYSILCMTSDPYLWAVRPYSFLLDKFWSWGRPDVYIAGYTPPSFPIPGNTHFISIDPNPFPTSRWSEALVYALSAIPTDVVLLMLEDYWLCRDVDIDGMGLLAEYIQSDERILKLDVTNDRIHRWDEAPDPIDVESIEHYDIIKSPDNAPYRMSLQSALWNRKRLMDVIPSGMTPWQVETKVAAAGEIILGTRQFPLRYANAILKGKVMSYEVERIPEPIRRDVWNMIPKEWGVNPYTG